MDNKSKEYVTLLGKSVIYCLPSISENSPIGILEWMSSGCAIVTTATTGCLEMSEWIWIYVKPTIKSIKKQLEYLIENNIISADLWKNLGRKPYLITIKMI